MTVRGEGLKDGRGTATGVVGRMADGGKEGKFGPADRNGNAYELTARWPSTIRRRPGLEIIPTASTGRRLDRGPSVEDGGPGHQADAAATKAGGAIGWDQCLCTRGARAPLDGGERSGTYHVRVRVTEGQGRAGRTRSAMEGKAKESRPRLTSPRLPQPPRVLPTRWCPPLPIPGHQEKLVAAGGWPATTSRSRSRSHP